MNATVANKSSDHAPDAQTLAQIVQRRAALDGDRIAYTFLADGDVDVRSMTWSQLDQRAKVLGAVLAGKGAVGQPILLALPSGLAFVESLFACWYAGAIAVPVSLPRHQRVKDRLDRIIADAGARFAVGTADTRQRLGGDRTVDSGLMWIDADAAGDCSSLDGARPSPSWDDVAILQYTSGSTGTPRGVVVTHGNLMRNSALIAEACGHGPDSTIAGWLPLFHDMGLVGLVLQAAFSGARCIFMPPERFLMRPWLWLKMISDYEACSSPAPNFAYDLCVDKIASEAKAGFDLSGWRNALNGSEPVRAATLDRFAAAFASRGFRSEALFPCYGLAEATLFVTGPGKTRRLTRRNAGGHLMRDTGTGGHVGCGQAFGDTQLAIVDPKTSRRVSPGQIGEIWVTGESIARGYWKNSDATAATFNAHIEGQPSENVADPSWLRTGDLGFIADGELFITGRLRELIIISGRNLFPVDLERTVESADPAIATSGAVAFSVDVAGIERLIIAAEVRREFRRPRTGSADEIDVEAICRRIRTAVSVEHDVVPHEVVLLCPGAVPRTTSGKISRRSTRDAYLDQTLERFEGSPHANAVR